MLSGEQIAQALQQWGLPNELVVAVISALPIVELRGAIPIGHHLMNMDPIPTFILSVVGNMLPVFFILKFLGPLSNLMMKIPLGKRFFDWLFARTRSKSESIQKYEALGLMIFVAIPFPVTGAWTGR